MCCIDAIQESRMSAVGAQYISIPFAYHGARINGRQLLQQLSDPGVTSGVSKTGIVEAAPHARTRRSDAVGMTLRCLPRYDPSGAKNSTVQYSVPPPRSMTPTTR